MDILVFLCIIIFFNLTLIIDFEFCFTNTLVQGCYFFQGDSGGPLQVRINLPSSSQGAMHFIVGITSFGFECSLPDTPAVYTRVSSFVDWIESIVWR